MQKSCFSVSRYWQLCVFVFLADILGEGFHCRFFERHLLYVVISAIWSSENPLASRRHCSNSSWADKVRVDIYRIFRAQKTTVCVVQSSFQVLIIIFICLSTAVAMACCTHFTLLPEGNTSLGCGEALFRWVEFFQSYYTRTAWSSHLVFQCLYSIFLISLQSLWRCVPGIGMYFCALHGLTQFTRLVFHILCLPVNHAN